MIERGSRGQITAVAWRRLVECWSRDYDFRRSNIVASYLQPRGLSTVLDTLRAGRHGFRYAVSGSLAAERFAAPHAPVRLAMLYVDDVDGAAAELGLRPVEGGANVLLAATEHGVAFERAVGADDLTLAAPSQVAVDLLTGPGRSPPEAEALLDWMESDGSAWRH